MSKWFIMLFDITYMKKIWGKGENLCLGIKFESNINIGKAELSSNKFL
jgi:hypothetical protein